MESSKMYTNYSQLNMLGMGSSMGYQNFLGGGLGMGSFGMGSLFGTGFGGCNMFQSCDGSYNYDAMAGFGVASVLTNCLFGFLGQAVSAKKAKQADAPEDKLSNLDSQINDELKKFPAGFNTVETYKNCKIENTTEYTTWKALSDKCDANQKIVDNYDVLNDATIESYTELHKKWVAATGEEKTKLKTQLDAMKPEYDKAKEAQQKYNQAKEVLKTDKPKLEAAETAKNEKATEISAAQTKLAELIASKDVITTESNDKILDKADGHDYQQTKLTELNSLFTVDGEGKEAFFSKDVRSTHKDIRGAVAQYRLAKSDSEKQKWANRISIIWNNLSEDDQKNNKDIIAGIDAMRKNYPNLKFENV